MRGLAAQATAVATMILNGQMDLETSRAYSAIVRGVGQLVSAEVAKARAERRPPNLEL